MYSVIGSRLESEVAQMTYTSLLEQLKRSHCNLYTIPSSTHPPPHHVDQRSTVSAATPIARSRGHDVSSRAIPIDHNTVVIYIFLQYNIKQNYSTTTPLPPSTILYCIPSFSNAIYIGREIGFWSWNCFSKSLSAAQRDACKYTSSNVFFTYTSS